MFQLLLAIIYISFISLGLPDSLLGAAWPSIYPQLDVPVSYAGIISMIIAFGTIVSSLQSDRLTRKLGTGKVTFIIHSSKQNIRIHPNKILESIQTKYSNPSKYILKLYELPIDFSVKV